MKAYLIAAGFALALPHVAARPLRLDQFVLKPLADGPLDPFGDERRALKHSLVLEDVFGGEDLDWKYHTFAAWDDNKVKYPGIILDPSHLEKVPAVNLTKPLPSLAPCDPEQTFIVAITDPDAPSRDDPKNGEFCHYVGEYACRAADIVTSELDLEHIKDLQDYTPPAPPSGTGTHRYVVAVLIPDADDFKRDDLKAPSDRKHWGYDKSGQGLQQWAKDNKLKPVGATFFQAMHQKDD